MAIFYNANAMQDRRLLQVNKVLYKDNEFKLAIDDMGLYLCILGNRYELSSHYYEPCTYIKSQDGTVDIIMHGAFDFGLMISSSGEWKCKDFSPLQLCEVIKKEVLKDKTRKKQQIVKETGYKTACNSNQTQNNAENVKTERIGSRVMFHGIECEVSSSYDKSRYRLIAIGGTYEQLQKDKSFTEYHEWGAIALPVICPCCNKTTWFDDTDIPNGEKYEVLCDNCKTSIIRKK